MSVAVLQNNKKYILFGVVLVGLLVGSLYESARVNKTSLDLSPTISPAVQTATPSAALSAAPTLKATPSAAIKQTYEKYSLTPTTKK